MSVKTFNHAQFYPCLFNTTENRRKGNCDKGQKPFWQMQRKPLLLDSSLQNSGLSFKKGVNILMSLIPTCYENMLLPRCVKLPFIRGILTFLPHCSKVIPVLNEGLPEAIWSLDSSFTRVVKGLTKLTLKVKIKLQAQGKGENLICHLVYQTRHPYWEQALLFLD